MSSPPPTESPPRLRLGILLSGTGRTLVNLSDRIAAGSLAAEIALVISDRPDVVGLHRAHALGHPTAVTREASATFDLLREHRVDLVCLAGYLRLLPIPEDFAGRVLNIHPSLLPKFGGRGMYGHHVHEAVLAAHERESGCTVHLCDDQYDHGTVLLQRRVPVLPGDDADKLAARVFAAECEAYPAAIAAWVSRVAG
ncbi:MAG: phosphoribosylglycinamide formyltransferase [Planctomycetota bacterium]